MVEDWEEYSRRHALRKGVLWGLGITAVAGGMVVGARELIKLTEDDPKFKITTKPAGDVTRPIDQDEVNRVYDGLYETIKVARDKAEATGKDLVILVAETHQSKLNLLNNIMVDDIAARLGVRKKVAETSMDLGSVMQTNREDYDSIRKQLIGNARKQEYCSESARKMMSDYTTLPEQDKRDADLAGTALFVVNGSPLEEQATTHHINALLRANVARDMTIVNGEPLNPRVSTEEKRLLPEFEDKVISIVKKQKGHRIAQYGHAHMVPIHKALKADPKVELVTLDTTNLELHGFDKIPAGTKLKGNVKAERYLEMWHMEHDAKENIRKVVTQGAEPASWGEAYKLAMSASFAHREGHAEVKDHLPKERAKVLQDLLADSLLESNRWQDAHKNRQK